MYLTCRTAQERLWYSHFPPHTLSTVAHATNFPSFLSPYAVYTHAQAEAATQQLQQHEVAAAPLLAEVEALRPKLTTSVRFRKQKAKVGRVPGP